MPYNRYLVGTCSRTKCAGFELGAVLIQVTIHNRADNFFFASNVNRNFAHRRHTVLLS